ncbi:MAG: hypothetical protein KAR22_27720, partial [Gammaproteobacteria bacterium]|nr:hypothetical protein [Gammaproteobacteria bacterium]
MRRCDVVPSLEFDPDIDFTQSPAWFLDGTHSVPPWTPMFGWFWVNLCRHGMQYGAEKLSLPTVRGWDWRLKNGGGYFSPLLVTSKEERAQREEGFRKAIRPFVTDFDGLWQGFIVEMLGHYEELKKLDVEKATNIELLENFEQTINVTRRMWEIHMYMMYGTFTAYILFESICQELFGFNDTSPVFQQLMSGFDNKVLQVNKRIWEFSKQAEEMGVAHLFLDNETNEIFGALEADPQGREFLSAFKEFLDEDGWRMQRMAELNQPTWIEDPTPALTNVKQFLIKGGTFDL